MDPLLSQLTQKEKQTLRLIGRGHDAKSAAAQLGLSVHTINERLRAARRKLQVTSSKAAARHLFENEGDAARSAPNFVVHERIGDAPIDPATNPGVNAAKLRGIAFVIGGILLMMTLILALAFGPTLPAALAPTPTTSAGTPQTADASAAPAQRPIGEKATALETVQLKEFERAALAWLGLVDRSDWAASFAASGESFQKLNTVKSWQTTSEQARVPLGAVVERRVHTAEFVNAPPLGYVILEFHTDFSAQTGAVETVTLEKSNGLWEVVGYTIDQP